MLLASKINEMGHLILANGGTGKFQTKNFKLRRSFGQKARFFIFPWNTFKEKNSEVSLVTFKCPFEKHLELYPTEVYGKILFKGQ